MFRVLGYAAHAEKSQLTPFFFYRREPEAHDVQIRILYTGVCHSDLHKVRNDWGGASYPMVPGHEIVGEVVRVGACVTKFKVGDFAGVGCLVDSCRVCDACKTDLEQYCEQGSTLTYNDFERGTRQPTYGGYSKQIVVDERFVVKIARNLDLKSVAPLLCAGITTYSALRHWNVGTGQKVGIIGMGGLGHMGIKFAKAFGAHVVMLTRSHEKLKDAERLGADEVIVTSDEKMMGAHAASFDFLLNTIPVGHDINPYIKLLKRDRTMTIVGALEELTPPLSGVNLVDGRKSVSGSDIGGLRETQEMMNFCSLHEIVSDVELISMSYINEAFERMQKNDVKYRFVIDMNTLNENVDP